MESVVFSEQHLDNIKAVIFGQQKQANVINDAVVKMIARELSSKTGKDDLFTVDDAEFAISEYLKAAVDGSGQYSEDGLMLIAGEQSLANLKSGQPLTVTAEPASETSTKVNFRIQLLGVVDDVEIDNTGEHGDVPVHTADATTTTAAPSRGIDPNADFQTQADQLVAAISPLVPDAVKTEVADKYAQCLVCAQQYFAYRA